MRLYSTSLYYINVIQITNNFGKEGKMKVRLMRQKVLSIDIEMITKNLLCGMELNANIIKHIHLKTLEIVIQATSAKRRRQAIVAMKNTISKLKAMLITSWIETTLQPIDTLQKQTLHYIHTTKSL